jgi:CO/xanthine dehydrogenase Mo-binding subunit
MPHRWVPARLAAGPTAAAIANALFDALHVRVRDLPLTAERIVAAMA